MNVYDSFRNRNRRKTMQNKKSKIDCNIPKLNNLSRNSINSTKIKDLNNFIIQNNKNKNNINSNHIINTKQKKSLDNNPLNLRKIISDKISYNNPINNKINYNNGNDPQRHSMEIFQTKTKKFFEKHNINKKNGLDYRISFNYPKNTPTIKRLNSIENNIKKAINNMRIQIENNGKESQITTDILGKLKKSRLSSPNLNIVFLKKKEKKKKGKNLQKSLIEEIHVSDIDSSFQKESFIHRAKSYDLSEYSKKKLLINLKHKIYKNNFNNKINTISDKNDDSDSNNDSLKGFSFHPNSYYIFIFDLLLIFANLFSFIFIPLNLASNKFIREKEHIIKKIINYSIDIIFLFDFIISFFRGYYNFEMEIVRNNKKIIIHYLNNYFFIDLIESIPIYIIIRCFLQSKENIYSYYNDNSLIFATFLLFIKPFKIFKILRKKQNKALEDFLSYLSENYYLEETIKFLINFIIFFLFIHLFVCFHLYLSFLNYPNWTINSNMMNYSFWEKYVTSFYFMITTMTTVGYGDIVCASSIERIYHIILLAIGTLLYTFLVSKIGNYLRDKSHEQIKLSKDLDILENLRITYPAMTFKLYSKIKNHLQSIFTKRKKTGISLLLNGVPDAIKNDLLLKIYSNVINGFIIFKNVKNSNFILQMLTSFIPITSKKEEVIILEKEIIQNIVFVKDGRLTMEISIDLNDPYNSINKYIEVNFIGISRKEELKINNKFNKRINSLMNDENKNYNDLKHELDKILLDNIKTTKINISHRSSHGISFDLGRMDFSLKELEEENDKKIIQKLKIIDIRKNEFYGDIHLFSQQPSPFTVKTKSRIAELLLLRKHDAISISKNFPNIWKRIESKSFHNLVSIKKLTFKTLKKYYNMNIYNTKSKENNIAFNLDITKNSDISFMDNSRLNITNNLIPKTINLSNKSMNKSINKSIYQNSSNKNVINKNIKNYMELKNLSYNKNSNNNRNSNGDSFDNVLYFSSESCKSNHKKNNNSDFEFPLVNIKEQKEEFSINHKSDSFENNKLIEFNKNQSFDNITFKNEDEGNKFSNLLSPKVLKGQNKVKQSHSKFKTSIGYNNKGGNINNTLKKKEKYILKPVHSSNSEQLRFNRIKTKQFDNNINILTLNDINQNFSKKIKKIIKKRKKFRKLKELLKFQRFKVNKNLLELYSQRNQNIKKNINENITKKMNDINCSFSSSKRKEIFQIIDSTNSEDYSSSYSKINSKLQSLKIETKDSFEIKSSYKNINQLSKGKIIKNKNYKKFLEKLIKNYLNKKISKEIYKSILVFISKIIREEKNNQSIFFNNINEEENQEYSNEFSQKNNEEEVYSEGKNSIIKSQYKNLISDESKNYSSSKLFFRHKTEQTCKEDKFTFFKDRNSAKFFDKELLNLNSFNYQSNEYYKNKEKKQKDNLKSNNIKEDSIIQGNKIYKQKDLNNNLKSEVINTNDIILSLNENGNADKGRNANQSSNSFAKMININKSSKELSKNCILF